VPILDAVVPVAGLGTRLLPATKALPKAMLPIGRTPVVQLVVEELRRAGVERVLFVTGRGAGPLEDHFAEDPELTRALQVGGREELLAELEFERAGVRFLYTRQRRALGLGDALLCAEGFVRGPFHVALGDAVLGLGRPASVAARLATAVETTGAACALAVEEVDVSVVSRYGIVAPVGEPEALPCGGTMLRVDDVVEKPRPEQAPSRLAVAARYVLSPAVLDALRRTTPGAGGELQLADALRILLAEGADVVAVPLEPGERRHDVGTPAGYARAFLNWALGDPELGPELRDHARELLERPDAPPEGAV